MSRFFPSWDRPKMNFSNFTVSVTRRVPSLLGSSHQRSWVRACSVYSASEMHEQSSYLNFEENRAISEPSGWPGPKISGSSWKRRWDLSILRQAHQDSSLKYNRHVLSRVSQRFLVLRLGSSFFVIHHECWHHLRTWSRIQKEAPSLNVILF